MLNEHNHKVCFLPAYSSNLAPIELWFSFFKQKLGEISIKEKVRLGSIESQKQAINYSKKTSKRINNQILYEVSQRIKALT